MSAEHAKGTGSALGLAATLEGSAPVRLQNASSVAVAPTLLDSGGAGLGEGNAPPPDDPLPARIGRYAVLRRLGRGAMGVVYSAYDPELDRKVAIKVMRDAMRGRDQGRKRVLQEAQTLARLSHPNVVQIYEVGEDDSAAGRPVFIAMEYVAGLSLRHFQEQHPLHAKNDLDTLLRLYLQAAAGLSAAHQSGLVHRGPMTPKMTLAKQVLSGEIGTTAETQ
ncbi:MAG TPA: serine/threonine-protein kinase [Pseudomonadota bacterium]|nr:serine/threonine-protein kinase [Pseudomonadota bacterium]